MENTIANGSAVASVGNSQSNPSLALEQAQTAMQYDANSWMATLGAGQAYMTMGNHAAAKQAFDTLVVQQPGLSLAYSRRALAKLALGDLDGAMKDAQQAQTLNPDDSIAGQVAALVKAGQSGPLAVKKVSAPNFQAKEAGLGSGKTLTGTVLLEGTSALALRTGATPQQQEAMNLARHAQGLYGIGDYAGAMDEATKALVMDAENPLAYLVRGESKQATGDHAGAVDDTTQSLKIQATMEALLARVLSLNKLGRFQDALKDADLAVQAHPESAMGYLARAEAHRGLGDRDLFLADLKKASELDPKFKERYEQELAKAGGGTVEGAGAGRKFPWQGRAATGAWVGAGIVLVLASAAFVALAKNRSAAKSGPIVSTPVPSFPEAVLFQSPATRKGTLLKERYLVEDPVGRGGMGMVHQAKDVTLMRKVALKELLPGMGLQPEDRERFLREAQFLASLQHPNIVAIYDTFEDHGTLFLVCELVDGESLDRLIRKKGRFPADEAAQVLGQIAKAVEHAHSKGIEHRDLKPSNIMIAKDGTVKVMDFGIAHKAKETVSKLSRTGSFGTPAYMPPEQERGLTSKHTDIYALGVTSYEMLTGEVPYEPPTTQAKLERIYPAASKKEPDVPPAVDDVIYKALAPEPEGRYNSVREFWDAFRSAITGKPQSA